MCCRRELPCKASITQRSRQMGRLRHCYPTRRWCSPTTKGPARGLIKVGAGQSFDYLPLKAE